MKLFKLFESKELNFELVRLQKYITDNDLETELEIEDNKIVFRVGEELIEWDVVEARRIRTEVMTNSKQSYLYANDVIKGQFELGEPAISKDADNSYYYARNMIKGRFELGEPVILKDAKYSQKYKEFAPRKSF